MRCLESFAALLPVLFAVFRIGPVSSPMLPLQVLKLADLSPPSGSWTWKPLNFPSYQLGGFKWNQAPSNALALCPEACSRLCQTHCTAHCPGRWARQQLGGDACSQLLDLPAHLKQPGRAMSAIGLA